MNDNAEDKIRILLVEDEEGPAEVLRKTIGENWTNVDIQVEQDFERALSLLGPHAFDTIILDLFLGNPAQNVKAGQKIWERVWKAKLVPIIIHTAGECDLEPEIPANNPFFKCITKRGGSDLEVTQYLKSVKPHILALRQVETEFNMVIHSVIEQVSPLIWQAETNDRLRPELLVGLTEKGEAGFTRIASIDSPFREQIAWAHLQIAGRPGVPERDIDKWTQEILER